MNIQYLIGLITLRTYIEKVITFAIKLWGFSEFGKV